MYTMVCEDAVKFWNHEDILFTQTQCTIFCDVKYSQTNSIIIIQLYYTQLYNLQCEHHRSTCRCSHNNILLMFIKRWLFFRKVFFAHWSSSDQKNQNKSKYFPPIFVKKKLTEGRYCTFMERLENLSFRAWIKKIYQLILFNFLQNIMKT